MPEGPFGFSRPFGLGPFTSDDSDILERTIGLPRDDRVEVHFHSSEDMRELRNEEVALFVTSPPYNIGWNYGSFKDEMDYNGEYLPLLARVFEEAHKKLMPGGRLCVNVFTLDKASNAGPNTTMEGAIPVASDIVDMVVPEAGEEEPVNEDIRRFQENTSFHLDHHIIWDKGAGGSSKAPFGSLPEPWSIFLNIRHESILVFRKSGKREFKTIPDEFRDASELERDFYTGNPRDDVWRINPSQALKINGESVPTFPEEIPRRLIRWYSFVGDIVADPFTGAGTTLKMAKENDRIAVGYEIRESIRPLIEEVVGESV